MLFLTLLIFLGQFINLIIFGGRLLLKNKRQQHFIKYKNRAMSRGKVLESPHPLLKDVQVQLFSTGSSGPLGYSGKHSAADLPVLDDHQHFPALPVGDRGFHAFVREAHSQKEAVQVVKSSKRKTHERGDRVESLGDSHHHDRRVFEGQEGQQPPDHRGLTSDAGFFGFSGTAASLRGAPCSQSGDQDVEVHRT